MQIRHSLQPKSLITTLLGKTSLHRYYRYHYTLARKYYARVAF